MTAEQQAYYQWYQQYYNYSGYPTHQQQGSSVNGNTMKHENKSTLNGKNDNDSSFKHDKKSGSQRQDNLKPEKKANRDQ